MNRTDLVAPAALITTRGEHLSLHMAGLSETVRVVDGQACRALADRLLAALSTPNPPTDMPRSENIHAFTEPAGSFPAYLSLNKDDEGRLTLTVRSRGNSGRDQAQIELQPEQLDNLAADILHYLHINR